MYARITHIFFYYKTVLTKFCFQIVYLSVWLFFIVFSPIFYDIENRRFMFDFDTESILVIALFVSVLSWYILALGRKNRLHKVLSYAFSQYVSEDVAKQVLKSQWDIKLEWVRKKICISFSDIEWFSNLTYKFGAEEIVSFLREYFEVMTSNIQKDRWYIDKYEWDSIMSLWWAFDLNYNKNSYDACISALKQQKALKILNIKFNKIFWRDIKVRIWINAWEAIIWNIGAPWKKIDFTALWEAVNTASRLEYVNKKYWTKICVSNIVYEENKDKLEFRELDRVKLKWINEYVPVYELLGEKTKLSKDTIKKNNAYFEWRTLYKNWNYKEAYNIFQTLSDGDIASKVMMKKCSESLKQKIF